MNNETPKCEWCNGTPLPGCLRGGYQLDSDGRQVACAGMVAAATSISRRRLANEAWQHFPTGRRFADAAIGAPAGRPELAAAHETARGWLDRFLFGKRPGENLIVVGPYGTGKSHLAAAIANAARAAGRSTAFVGEADLFSRLRRGSRHDRGDDLDTEDVLDLLARVELLVLDDVGKVKPTDFVIEHFFGLIDRRYAELRPVVLTSNLTGSQLAATSDSMTAALDRLRQTCTIIKLGGASLRAAGSAS